MHSFGCTTTERLKDRDWVGASWRPKFLLLQPVHVCESAFARDVPKTEFLPTWISRAISDFRYCFSTAQPNLPPITEPWEPRVHSPYLKLDVAPNVAVLPRQNQGWWRRGCFARWSQTSQSPFPGLPEAVTGHIFSSNYTLHCHGQYLFSSVQPVHVGSRQPRSPPNPTICWAWERVSQRLCCLLLRGGSWNKGQTTFWSPYGGPLHLSLKAFLLQTTYLILRAGARGQA